MDIAAGNGREPALFNGKPGPAAVPTSRLQGSRPARQIISVQLQSFDGRGFIGNSCHLLEAVQYIFERADQLGLPAVVNLSLSSTGGPHDGTTLIEQGFEALVKAKRGRAIVTSAGNSYALRSHLLFGKVSKGTTIDWVPDPRASATSTKRSRAEMEIWYPRNAELRVALHAPGAGKTHVLLGEIARGETKELYAGTTRLGRISHREKDRNNGDNQIDLRLPFVEDWPEDSPDPRPWRINIRSKATQATVPFHAWIEQSERGLAYFAVETTDPQFTLPICCGQGTLTVGAFDTFEMASLAPPYEFTSSGPIRATDGIKSQTMPSDTQSLGCKVHQALEDQQAGALRPRSEYRRRPLARGVRPAPACGPARQGAADRPAPANLSGRSSLSWEEILDDPDVWPQTAHPKNLNRIRGWATAGINGPAAIAELLTSSLRSITVDLKLTSRSDGR